MGENMNDDKNPFKEESSIDTDNVDIANEDDAKNDSIDNNVEFEQIDDTNDNYKIKYEELNNKYIRLAADFDNFRKRTVQEKEDLSKYANADLLKKIITVLDTFDRAYEHLKDIDNCKTVKDSYEVAFKQLCETLKKIGLEEIEAANKPFNPQEHEAIAKVPSDELEPDTVAYVAQKGYKLADRVLRPALVGVVGEKEENKENE